ncbi:MAG: alpha-L-fucosidase [Planctomycetales bacterium]|nr:alpha-L-fucosidase [Planctomycetales bacterium]
MRTFALLNLLLALVVTATRTVAAQSPGADAAYHPTPVNLSARDEFRQARFGVFIHWGVYSVLGQGEWVMNNSKLTVADYEPLAQKFNPTKFDAAAWVALFKRAGAEYITITSKHHDGFAMWDSKVSDWDIVDRTPYGKDVLKQLAEECERQGIKLFFYHSHLDWHHPDYFPRGRTGRASGRPAEGDFNRYLDYMDAQLTELLSGDYGQVAGIWFDGWWDQQSKGLGHPDAPPHQTQVDWRLPQTYALIHQLQPAALIGNNHHVLPFAGEDFQMFERDLPGENTTGFSEDAGIGSLPLETCDTINGSWGYNSSDQKFKSVKDLVHYLVRAAGRDANLLLNIGPRPDGTIDPDSTARLEGVGEWLKTFAPTVKGTRGGPLPPQAWGVTTRTDELVYVHVLNRPAADAAGWTTLPNTDKLVADQVTQFPSNTIVESRRGSNGDLVVRLSNDVDTVDTVLTLPTPR